MAFTFFFRDSYTLEQAINLMIPAVDGLRKIRVWNAGCAMGPETYTFAILLAEKMNLHMFKYVAIDATDIDEDDNFGDKITNGIYHYDEIKRVPEAILKKYFKKTDDNNNYKIDENLRCRIKFTRHDLLSFNPVGNNYNLIICKNVLLHFQPHERVKVLNMFHSVLAHDGLLVMEQTQQMPKENQGQFKKAATDANVYQKINNI